MSCKLRLDIPQNKIKEINTELFNDYEISGIINCDDNDKVLSVSKNKGDSDSVYTPNHVINYHTHPINAYRKGGTIWGWPSGEDIRETLKFALAGNKAHLVFTYEGIYSIQVSPCKIKKMKNLLNCEERGILIFLIEEYFKTTHNFRGVEEVNSLREKNININPYSYVDFINNFDISNLNLAKTILHKKPKNNENFGNTFSKIPNVGFPEMENNYIVNIPMKEYISPEDLKEILHISESGKEINGRINNAISKFKIILKKFNANKCTSSWNNNPNSWFWVNFFPSNYYNPDLKKSPPKIDKPIVILKQPFIKIFSNSSEGCSITEIGKIHNFKINKRTESFKNTFGNGEVTPQQRFLLYRIAIHDNDYIPESLQFKVNEFITNNKLKVPMISLNQIENEIKKINNNK